MTHVQILEVTTGGEQDAWRHAAACKDLDPSVFFPVGVTGPAEQQIATAKQICASCPVRLECLEFAMATKQNFGVWGGYDEEERREMRRRLRRIQPPVRAVYEVEELDVELDAPIDLTGHSVN